MIKINIKSNMDQFLKKVKRHHEQFPIIVRKAVNDAVREAEKAMLLAMDTEFDRPTPFTKKGTLANFANQSRGATGEIIIKDKQAEYLNIHDKGGIDRPRRKAHAVGVSVKRDSYGNPRRAERKRLYEQVGQKGTKGAKYFISTGKTKRDKHLPPGLYKRGTWEDDQGNKRSKPHLIYYHVKSRKYHKRWHPKAVFRVVAKKEFERSMQKRLTQEGML